jgi:TRAP-type C4-dicarboxylate transport system permease small subunit
MPDRLLRATAALLLIALLISVVAGVVSRQLGAPLPWTDELAQYLLVWTGFAGWLIASRNKSHIRITVLTDRLPGVSARITELLTQACIAAFGLGILWFSFSLIRRNWDVESISLPVTAAFLYMPLPLLGVVLVFQAAADGRAALRGRIRVAGGQIL